MDATASIEPIGGHVLLVEDDPVNAAVAQGYLETLGCTSVWTKDGAEAIARSAAERFDLILMDLSMPGFDGFATTKWIRERAGDGNRIPIVALTAHDAGQYRERCAAAGMNDVLSKPYTLEACARVLRRWIAAGDPPKATTLSSIDSKAVARLRGLGAQGRGDLFPRLVELFRAGSAQDLARLGASLRDGDLAAARSVCHKLKSSAANVGAKAFSDDVRQLEHLCSAGDGNGARALFERLQAAHPALLDALMAHRLKESA
jgi:CheY-like chemotaxis protein/HPt (histidine-containing phosphotransfer) domain-containing protein